MAKLTAPTFSLTFQELGSSAVTRGNKGTVAIIIRDAAEQAPVTLAQASQIPAALGVDNINYIKRAFLGYVDPPKKVIVYTVPVEGNVTSAFGYLESVEFDYLVGPVDCSAADAEEIASWVKSQRAAGTSKAKAVLPNFAGDDPGIVSFATVSLQAGETKYDAAAYCSRIAGLLAGTPMNISATYAPLTELSDCTRTTKAERDAAVGEGKLIAFWDGRKVKLCRAVNSLVTTTEVVKDSFKKIKIVEIMDLIRTDVHATVEDEYIGKFANTYENRMLLVAALRGYFETLRGDGLVQEGYTVDMDLDGIETYLQAKGIDTSDMDEQELRKANTDTHVFLLITCKILDAIEDIAIAIEI